MEYALIGAAVIVVVWAIVIYNTLVSYKTQVINGFAQIDVQLKRRLDLIPNLVETAKKYMQHEQDTLLAVTQARSGMLSALQQADAQPGHGDTLKALALSEQQLQGALSGFNLRLEAYPELKASANMQQLSEELVSTENRIAYARQGYNDLVQKYNEYRQSFPPILLASLFGHRDDAEPLDYAESREQLNQAPKVTF